MMGLISRFVAHILEGAERHEASAAVKTAGGFERVEAHAATIAVRKQYQQCIAKARENAQKTGTAAPASSASNAPDAPSTPTSIEGCKAILVEAGGRPTDISGGLSDGWYTVGGGVLLVCLLLLAFSWFQRRS